MPLASSRAATRRCYATWKRAGRLIEAERWARLGSLKLEERSAISVDLLSLWQPDMRGDNGQALVRVQRAFAQWRKKLL